MKRYCYVTVFTRQNISVFCFFRITCLRNICVLYLFRCLCLWTLDVFRNISSMFKTSASECMKEYSLYICTHIHVVSTVVWSDLLIMEDLNSDWCSKAHTKPLQMGELKSVCRQKLFSNVFHLLSHFSTFTLTSLHTFVICHSVR